MAPKREIDWGAIEGEYRSGQLSVREIARQYKVSDVAILKRAKKEGWTRDLAAEVRRRVREKLVSSDAVSTKVSKRNANRKDLIEGASDRGVEVVKCHRKDISNLQSLEQKLLTELGDKPTKLYLAQHRGKIIKEEVGIAVTERAAALQALANAQHKRIQLERQAFNLDEHSGDPNTPDAVTVTYHRQV